MTFTSHALRRSLVAHGTKFWCTTSRIGVRLLCVMVYILGPRMSCVFVMLTKSYKDALTQGDIH